MENFFNKKKQKTIKVSRGAIFDTDQIQIDLGLWLELIRKPIELPYFEWERLVKGRLVNLAREKIVKPEVLDSIQPKFLELIRPVIGDETVFSLYDYDKDKGTFKCEFETGETIDVKFMFGWIEEGPEITFDDGTEKKVYDFYNEREDNKAHLELRSYTKKLGGEKVFHHYVFNQSYYASLSDRNKDIIVSISYKKDVPVDEQVNKEILQQAISSLSLDATLEEICSAIVKGILIDPKDINEIKVEKKAKVIEHRGGSPISKTQELICFSNGEIKNLILVRNGKTVHIDNFKAWSYKDNMFSVSGNDENNTYSVTVKADSDKLDEAIVPRDYVTIASQELEETKKLTLAPINKNK